MSELKLDEYPKTKGRPFFAEVKLGTKYGKIIDPYHLFRYLARNEEERFISNKHYEFMGNQYGIALRRINDVIGGFRLDFVLDNKEGTKFYHFQRSYGDITDNEVMNEVSKNFIFELSGALNDVFLGSNRCFHCHKPKNKAK